MVLHIASLDEEGRGVARDPEGKVVFVEGALPGEEVEAEVLARRKSFDLARATRIHVSSPGRRAPGCPHFGVCGGCATQHADARTQMAAKQRGLEENLARIGGVQPDTLLPILYGPEWGYRHRARFSARFVYKKGRLLLGFRERRSTYVADLRECRVVHPSAGRRLESLAARIGELSIRDRVPQVEVAVGESATVLVFRHLEPLSGDDLASLRRLADEEGVHVWLQPKGPDTAHPLHPADSGLHYELPAFGLRLDFAPTEFTQVNPAINQALVSRAMRLLDPRPGERIADLFCGLGNFSLPIASLGADVVGFEGAASLIERARANARRNALVAQFQVLDLFRSSFVPFGPFDKLLVDPPREGAVEVMKALPDAWPRRIVYVSCDTATLARDAGVLVHTRGFRLLAAGVANMFPHTAHVESIALFER